MKTIVFLASGWGAKHGGVNSFNFDLVFSIGSYLSEEVKPVCVVESASTDEIKYALEKGVTLYQTTKGKFNSANITQIIKESNHDVCCWVGHDIITGIEAIECCRLFKDFLKFDCLSAVIHHMDYWSYYSSKTNDGSAAYLKASKQKEVFTNCGLVFAVGPYLKNTVDNMLKEAGIEKEVIELIPGLADIQNVNIDHPFKAISYGRLGDEDEVVKQGKLAVAAFSKMCKDERENSSQLTIIGLDDSKIKEKQAELIEIGYNYADKLCIINGLPYIDREEIYKLLRGQSASMMLSTHEGFGLAGWEAISAEIPLILSVDTGLYKFIEEHLGGAGEGCLFPVKISGKIENDLPAVSYALSQIKQDLNKARRNARSLKGQLKDITWDKTAGSLISHILINLKLGQVHKDNKYTYVENNDEMYSETTKEVAFSGEELQVEQSANLMTRTSSFKHPLYYSTSTVIANRIAEIYYDDLHYVWCTHTFNPSKTNPPSANPYEIYKNILKEVKNGVEGAWIQKHKAGLIQGVSKNRQNHKITVEQESEIIEMIYAAEMRYFKPIIYVIPGSQVLSQIKLVPRSKRSDLFSQEFLIEELNGKSLDIIDLE